MIFQNPLISGILIKRYKRFLADVIINNQTTQVYVPNTGSMLNCNQNGAKIWLSKNSNQCKLPYTWELIEVNKELIGINCNSTNKIVYEGIMNGTIPYLKTNNITKEIKVGNSRIDFLLDNHNKLCYIEVKNVSLFLNNYAQFPDAITKRGTKHLHTLINLVKNGNRCIMLYVAQKNKNHTKGFSIAKNIDPIYYDVMLQAIESGVEILCHTCQVDTNAITLSATTLPLKLQ